MKQLFPHLGILQSLLLLAAFLAVPHVSADEPLPPSTNHESSEFEKTVRPLLATYCFKCHNEVDPSGNIDLKSPQTSNEVDEAFENWRSAVRVLQDTTMPPSDEQAPSDEERQIIANWFQSRFVDNVIARPGPFRPRRLSVREYRNTLRSLLGFDLRANIAIAEDTISETSLVVKLLPTDPIGKSRYRNDTFSNPLTPIAWDSYSQLADSAIDELFSSAQKANLEAIAGEISQEGFSRDNAERLVRNLLPRALRRTVDDSRLRESIDRVNEAADMMSALRFELKSILMSPSFLYRGLLMDSIPGKQQAVDEFELAERLSYFLWSDMPDRELLEAAASGRLSPGNELERQADRMLNSPQAYNLAEDWGVQWLLLDDIMEVSTDVSSVASLSSQPVEFLDYLIREDRPLLELVDSKVDFVNILTVKFYAPDKKQLKPYSRPKGIENEIVPNQRIILEETKHRGGILTMPGILAMNRGPIIRGTWMLERILGVYLPDPPADVGQVQPNKEGENLTFRQRFEQHRSNATCALCHDKIDPLGFALESYDSNGDFLLTSAKSQKPDAEPIDTSGRLPTGESFADIEELKSILKSSQKEAVVRNIVVQMMSYALCRKLEFYDEPTIKEITQKMVHSNGTYRQLIREIVNSLPFRETMIAGETQ
jgi:Protein of unknown function (DUF1592)/Protein of unknown function (DUF1588)/Protein of unknown function (DUF1585)/Protein of unknown function (DUF1587)